jgi:hypothetical protein
MHLDPDAVLPWRQQVVDHVEAVRAARPVDAANVDETDELALRVVAQEGHQLDQVSRHRGQGQLAIGEFDGRSDCL